MYLTEHRNVVQLDSLQTRHPPRDADYTNRGMNTLTSDSLLTRQEGFADEQAESADLSRTAPRSSPADRSVCRGQDLT